MFEAIVLILLAAALVFNLLVGIALVRTRESVEAKLDRLSNLLDRHNTDIRRLSQELLVRLPPMPYGVDIEDRRPMLTIGPYDARIPS